MKHDILSPRASDFRALISMVLLCLFGMAQPAGAALRTWTGAGPNALWSTASNWSPAGAPQDGEDLSFPAGALQRTNSNDLPARTFGFILFNGASSDYELRGNAITLSRGMNAVNVPQSLQPQIFFDITLADSLRFVADDAGIAFGHVDLAGHTLTLNTATSNSFFSSGAEIRGIGDVVKIGVGEVLYGGGEGNSYQGTTHVKEGTLRIGKGNFNPHGGVPGRLIIGDSENGFVTTRGRVELLRANMLDDASTISFRNGQLDLNGFDEAVGLLEFFNGSIVTGTGTLFPLDRITGLSIFPVSGSSIAGRVFLQANTRIQVISSAGGLFISARISGPGGLTKENGGLLALSGINDFTGPVTVNDGMLRLENDRALDGVTSVTLDREGILGLRGVNIANKTLTINSAGAGLAAVFDPGTWNGPIHLNFTGTAKFNAGDRTDSSSLRLPGSIQGTGGIWFGGRTVELLANNTFTGPVRSACELLLLNTGAGRPFSGPLEVGGDYLNLRLVEDGITLFETNATAEVRWFSGGQNPNRPLTVRSNGFVNLNGNAEGFSSIDFYGGRVIGSAAINGDVTVHPENATAILSGSIGMHIPRFFAINNTLVTVGLYMDGTISGSGGIIKTGPGLMWIDGTGTYSDRVVIEGGVLHAGSSTALGARTAGTTVNAGGTLSLGSGAGFLGEPLSLAGGGSEGTNGALRSAFDIFITNNVVLNGLTTIRTEGTNSRIQIQGVISGVGPLTKVGSGVFGFRGNTDNIYAGDTIASEGTMRLTKPSGITSVPGHLIIGGGGGIFGTATIVEQGASFTILGSVTVNRGGLWNLNGFSEGFTVSLLEGRPPLTLNNGGDVQTGAGSLFLPVGGDVVVNPGTGVTGASFISGNLGLDPGPHQFIVQGGVSGIGFDFAELDLSATVSQTSTAADIVKEGGGELRLSAANSFTGPVTVNEGSLTAANALALGTAAGGVFVNGNAFLALDGGFEIAETLTLDSTNTAAILSLGPVTNVWSGNVILQRTAGIRVPDARGALTHFGIAGFGAPAPNISGPGGLTKSGPGALFIAGLNRGNSYTGPTTVNGGLLEAVRAGRSLSSNIVVTGPNSILRTGRPGDQFNVVRTVLPRGASVAVEEGALWTMSATNIETLSRLVGDGRLSVGTGGALTITNDVSCTFSGSFSGSGALNKYGPATFHVTGSSPSYTGLATVFDGTYKVDGNFIISPVTVKGGAQLRGNGVVGNVIVENGGVVRVDSEGPGQLGGDLVMDSVNFHNGGVLGLAFYGPHPTGGNDRLIVDDAVTLTTPSLSSGFVYPPREGDVITLIENSGVDAVSGTLSGLPPGAVRLIGDIPVVTSYVGGSGNDVTLTVTNLPLRGGGARLVSGQGGTNLVPNDCSQLRLVVTNRGAVALTGLRGKLRSFTPGVVVTMAESAYPNLAPNARGTNATPFQIRTEPGFVCAGGAQFELVLTASNLQAMAIAYTLPGGPNCNPGGGACESCFVVSGRFDTNALETERRLTATGLPSICDPSRLCPGFNELTNAPVRHMLHAFTNSTTAELCVTAKLRVVCPMPANALGVAAYAGEFRVNQPCSNYLGDDGATGPPFPPFSFRVPPQTNFLLVVTARTTNLACDTYALELFGLPCPPPAVQFAARPGPGPLIVQWSSAYPDFHLQSVNSLNGPGPSDFINVTNPPVLVNGKFAVTNATTAPRQFFRLESR